MPLHWWVAFNQQSNQAKERLMLGISPAVQKCAYVDIDQVTSRWGLRVMPAKSVAGIGVTAEKPPITIRAALKLSLLRLGLPIVPPEPLPRSSGMPCRTHLPAGGPLNGVGFVDKLDGPNP